MITVCQQSCANLELCFASAMYVYTFLNVCHTCVLSNEWNSFLHLKISSMYWKGPIHYKNFLSEIFLHIAKKWLWRVIAPIYSSLCIEGRKNTEHHYWIDLSLNDRRLSTTRQSSNGLQPQQTFPPRTYYTVMWKRCSNLEIKKVLQNPFASRRTVMMYVWVVIIRVKVAPRTKEGCCFSLGNC